MRFSKISKCIQIVSFIFLGIILFFWDFFESLLFQMDIKKIIGIVIAIAAASIFYFDERISQIIKGPKGLISNGTLSECLEKAIQNIKYIKHLRIYATSSEMILPLLSGHEIHIKKCSLLLCKYPEDTSKSKRKKRSYNQRVEDTINEWIYYQNNGYINDLQISRYSSIPSIYMVIFNDQIALIGHYYLCPDSDAGVEYLPPSLIHNVSTDSNITIQKCIRAFNLNFRNWAKKTN